MDQSPSRIIVTLLTDYGTSYLPLIKITIFIITFYLNLKRCFGVEECLEYVSSRLFYKYIKVGKIPWNFLWFDFSLLTGNLFYDDFNSFKDY